MRDNVQVDYFRKSITVPFLDYTLNEMITWLTDLHARTALALQLVPSIIEYSSITETPPPSKEFLEMPLIMLAHCNNHHQLHPDTLSCYLSCTTYLKTLHN